MSRLNKAYEMINRWIEEEEVSGTDHYIGREYDKEEYENLVFIKYYLSTQLAVNKILDNLYTVTRGEEGEHHETR